MKNLLKRIYIKLKKNGNYSKKDFEILKQIIENLQQQKGNMKGFEVIHIKSDWLLVFKIDDEYLSLVMLGKHTQVYKKFK